MENSLKYYARNLVMLRQLAPIFSTQCFFIFGCQRSGTTLLLSILNAHPQITGVDETEFHSPYPFPSAYRLFLNKINNRYSGYKIIEHSNKIEFIKKYYPQSKIIWIVRNPYSTIQSMKKLFSNGKNWISRCAVKELERLKPFYSALHNLDYDKLTEVEKAAIYWNYKNQFPQILTDNGLQLLHIKYENLLLNTEETTKEIINFLGLEWSAKLLEFHKHNKSKVLAGGTRTDRAINQDRVSSAEQFTPEALAQINVICQDSLNLYGYLLSTGQKA